MQQRTRSTAPGLSWLVLLAGLLAPALGRAQELDVEATDRCVRAAVRIVVPGPNGEPLASGSGSMIDARGYVLTNFHVVGNVSVDHGIPGTLLIADNRYEIALVESARESARPRYYARVVRADARLDLALLRIVSDVEGRPIPRATRFRTVELAGTADLRPGSRVWAFGYPMGVRTINVTGGQVTGFQMNALEAVAWLRSDAEFNPGNSGGMLVDARGRLVAVPTAVVHGRSTLEPIELARPSERIPPDWLTAMRSGIDDVRIDGVPELGESATLSDAALGDVGGIGEPEIHFFRVAPQLRPGVIRVDGEGVGLLLVDRSGRVLRRGVGSIELGANDPSELVLATVVEHAGEEAVRFELRAERRAPPPVAATVPPPFGPSFGVSQTYPPAQAPAMPPTTAPAPLPPGPRASIHGRVVDARTGEAVVGAMVLVARPGVDLGRQIAWLLEGRMSDRDFYGQLAGYSATDALGRYLIAELPTNTRFPAAAVARGHRAVMMEIAVGAEGSSIDLGVLPLGP